MKEVASWGTTGVSVCYHLIMIGQDSELTCVIGQFGRGLGPLIFCTLYWFAGRETAYATGAAGMVAVCGIVFGGLKVPPGTERVKKIKTKAT
jgi:hypothetical protein